MTSKTKESKPLFHARVEGIGDFTVSKSGEKYLLSGLIMKPVSFSGTAKELAAAIYRLSDYMWFPNQHPESDQDHRVLDNLCGFQTCVGQTFPEIEKETAIIEENV